MKIHVGYAFAISCALFSCTNSKTDQPASKVSFTDTYLAPTFTDTDRIEKMKAAFPAIDKIFHDYFEKNHFPGIAFGIVADGQLIYSNAFGVSDVKMMTQTTSKTNFRIASMTKSFTAVAILRLRDEGKLSLTDPVSKYIPEVSKVSYLTQDSQPMTIEHLLTMSAGFPEDNPWGDRQLADKNEDLIALLNEGISFSNAPGLTYEYSNLGFGMLGLIVNKVSGQPYQQYINDNILKPLQMNDTRWEFTEVPKEQLALGYRWEDNTFKEEPILHDGIFGAMGGLICSIEDFSKYVQFHLSAWPPRNEDESPVLKRSSLREMHQLQRFGALLSNFKTRSGNLCPTIGGYGYGLGYRKDCNGTVSIRHGGGLPGYGSEWRFFPDYGIGIVSLSNLTYGGLGSQNAAALDTLVYIAKLQPRVLPVSSILEQRQKEIVESIQTWPENKMNLFAENFFMDFSLESRKATSAEMLMKAGKIISVGKLIPENQLRGKFVIECEEKNILVFFTLTPEKTPLIQQLDLEVADK
ncbi:MAG: beta-lactamase family protein [Cyclobacteriaceae bacterium]|nr:beta-lactamase family protein [Cyclobacteriaceae bacterium]